MLLSGDMWQTVAQDIASVNGVHALWLMCYADDQQPDWELAVDWLMFDWAAIKDFLFKPCLADPPVHS